MQISGAKTVLRLRMSEKSIAELTHLLDLDDVNLARHKAGKLIRDNFRLRGWLKGKARGKPGFKTTTGDSQASVEQSRDI